MLWADKLNTEGGGEQGDKELVGQLGGSGSDGRLVAPTDRASDFLSVVSATPDQLPPQQSSCVRNQENRFLPSSDHLWDLPINERQSEIHGLDFPADGSHVNLSSSRFCSALHPGSGSPCERKRKQSGAPGTG